METTRLQIEIPKALKRQFQMAVLRNERTMTEILTRCIAEYVAREKDNGTA